MKIPTRYVIPFKEGNAVNRKFRNAMKTKFLCYGSAIGTYFVAANRAIAKEPVGTVFFTCLTCNFIKKGKEASFFVKLLSDDMYLILKRFFEMKRTGK